MTKITVALPVYNEEAALIGSVGKLHDFLEKNITDDWEITIVDNASTDSTLKIAGELSKNYPKVNFIHLDQKGRGRALKKCWGESKSDIVSYMDIDLSTGLDAFPKLIDSLKNGFDVATGSRFVKGSKVERSMKREILSKGYNSLLKIILNVGFMDAQCGFKAINRRTIEEIMPLVKDNEWFFDTELMYRAQKKKFRIKEIPVTWVEDAGSTVKIGSTVYSYIKLTLKLRFEFLKL